MLHWTLDKQAGACNSHDETKHRIKNQEVDGIGNEVEVGTLGEDSQGKRTTKPHGNEAYVSQGHNVGQVKVCKGLSAASQAQKHRQAYRHFYLCRKDEHDRLQALSKSHEEENSSHACCLHLSRRQ